jgi:hypothetical protein
VRITQQQPPHTPIFKVITNLALDIENDIENDTDTDTTTTTAQNHIVDKVVAATHSADHTMVSSEKQEGVTDLDFYRNQAYDLVKKIAFKQRHVALVFLFVFLAFLCLATLF